MTCIVGMLDRKEDCVYLGCDSMGSSNSNVIMSNSKVIKIKNSNNTCLAAITGNTKLINVLETTDIFDELKFKNNSINKEYFIRNFIPKLLNELYNFGCAMKNKDNPNIINIDGSIILAYKNQLYGIYSDGFLLEPEDDFVSFGSGQYYAYGSLESTKDSIEPISEKIHKALVAGEKYANGVRGPYYVFNTKNNDSVKYT